MAVDNEHANLHVAMSGNGNGILYLAPSLRFLARQVVLMFPVLGVASRFQIAQRDSQPKPQHRDFQSYESGLKEGDQSSACFQNGMWGKGLRMCFAHSISERETFPG